MTKDDINGVKVWFWPRSCNSIPPEVLQPPQFDQICTDNWGTPDASFPVDQCGYDAHFGDGHITVFDITFCVSPQFPLEAPNANPHDRATGQAPLSTRQIVAKVAVLASSVSHEYLFSLCVMRVIILQSWITVPMLSPRLIGR